MKNRLETLKMLASRFRDEVILANKELSVVNVSAQDKNEIRGNLARMKMVMDDADSYIDDSFLFFGSGDNLSLKEMESQYLIRALKACNGNLEKSAKWLGISSRTLSRRIEKSKIDVSVYKRNRPEYVLPSKGKYIDKYEGIVSWISERKIFWLDELKNNFGYDSKETQTPINTVLNFLRGKEIIKCCGREKTRICYSLVEDINKDDIMAYFNCNEELGRVLVNA